MDYRTIDKEAVERREKLCQAIPDVMKGFAGMRDAAFKDGALTAKTKALIAVALGVSVRCDACVTAHMQNAVRAGATREELAEAVGVAVMMGGGPSSVYAAAVLEAYDQFYAK
ncbi:MAG: carboxymuconolactone decarboxylase family protein [Fretibacterium sp.]|nr:carboxymuconolactone decarboxylase family protein [Fretibacterium sp.]